MNENNLSQQTAEIEDQGNDKNQPETTAQDSGKSATGAASIMSQFIQEPTNENQNQSKVEEPTVPEKTTGETGTESNPTEEPKSTEEIKPPAAGETTVPFKKWEEMTPSELIEKAKNFQSRYDKTKAEFDKLSSALNEREEMLRTIIQNPIDSFKKIAPEYSDIFELNRPIEKSVQNWQETVLLPELQKEFPNIVMEDWTPDPSEMANPLSPTYKYMTRTMQKESELRNRHEMAAQQRAETENLSKEMETVVLQQNMEDKHYLMNNYGLNETQIQEFAKKYDDMVAQTDPKNTYPDWHPNRVKNIIRSVFFDDIMNIKINQAVTDAVNKVHQEYKLKGVSVPGKNMPVDITSVSTKNTEPVKNNTNSNSKSAFNSLFRNI